MNLLRKVAEGETPEMVYTEAYANADHHEKRPDDE